MTGLPPQDDQTPEPPEDGARRPGRGRRRGKAGGGGPLALLRRLRQPGSLSSRMLAFGAWRMGGLGFSQALRLTSNLILTRLLAPEAFGLLAIVFAMHTAAVMMTDIGVGQAIVRSRNGDDVRFIRTAWTVKFLKHVLVAAILCAAAGLLPFAQAAFDFGDTVYADPRLAALLAVSTLVVVLKGAESATFEIAERKMAVGRIVRVTMLSQLCALCVTVGYAWFIPSVWAMVFGAITGATMRVVLSFVMVPGPRMGFLIDREYFAEIWSFGKWLIGASMFGFLTNMGDRILMAALLTPTDFGMYAIARLWVDAAAGVINRVSRPVSFSAIAEVSQNRPEALARIFGKIRLAQNLLCVGVFLVFALIGPQAVTLLYTDTFAPVGPRVAALAPIILFLIYLPLVSLILNAGDSRNLAAVTAIRGVVLFATVPLCFHLLGEPAALFAIAVNSAVGVPKQIQLAARIIPLSIPAEIARLAAAVAAAAALMLLV